MAIDFNTEPFYDDYDEDKKFYRILFRPGTAVQARELTQLQTILQEQIKRHGDHIFKEGAMVIPGQVSYDLNVRSVKLLNDANVNFSVIFDRIDGQLITNRIPSQQNNLNAGVIAKVVASSVAEGNDPPTIFVKFISAGINLTTGESISEFLPEDNLFLLDGTSLPFNIEVAPEDQITGWPVQAASTASVSRGVYYIRGHFVLVSESTIILDKYNNKPSYRIGLKFVEDTIYPEEDESLLDNALGSPNYSAPGAARYYIDLTLTKLALNSAADEDFIDLLRLNNGNVIFKLDRTEYAELEKTLARRTYDESGDYTLKPFPIKPREYRSNYRGNWSPATAYVQGDIIQIVTNGVNIDYYVCTNDGISLSNQPTFSPALAVIQDGTQANPLLWEYVKLPIFNNGVNQFLGGDDNEYILGENSYTIQDFTINDHKRLSSMIMYAIEPSKAYVRGYEIEKITTEYVPAFKSRNVPAGSNALCAYLGVESGSLTAITSSISNELETSIDLSMGSYAIATNLKHSPDLTKFTRVNLNSTTWASAGAGTVIGTARVRGIDLHSDVVGGYENDQYKVFLFDINMRPGTDFSQVKSIYTITTLDNAFRCNFIQQDNSTTLVDPSNFSSIYPLPDFAISEITDATFTVVYQTSITTTTNQTIVTINAPSGTQWESVSGIGNYTIIKSNNGEYKQIGSGPGQIKLSIVSGALKLEQLEGSSSYSVIGTLTVDATNASTPLTIPSDAIETFKVTGRVSVTNGSANVTGINTTFTSEFVPGDPITIGGASYTVLYVGGWGANGADNTKLTLSNNYRGANNNNVAYVIPRKTYTLQKGYVNRLVSVMMKATESATTYTVDITNRFIFDNGQAETHISAGKLVLAPNAVTPPFDIQVRYEYIAPNIGGDAIGRFFSVNSYTHANSNMTYESIAPYKNYELRDSLDFRPYATDSSGELYARSLPKFGRNATINYRKYLGRTDNISLNSSGKFVVTYGVPSTNPVEPSLPTDSMKLAVVQVEPYTFEPSNGLKITRVENKRYTMRDIGKLENRIKDLEYYTALSLLEADTNGLRIVDSGGFERYQNGFLVDSFNGQGIGNSASPEWNASIDSKNQELRPFFVQRQVELLELRGGGTTYKVQGDIITLPLDGTNPEVSMISQMRRSKTESVNPYDIFTFKGIMNLNPWSDTWFSTGRRPDIVINDEGQYNAVVAKAEADGVLGTVWNAWQVIFQGQPVTTGSRLQTISSENQGNRFANIDTAIINAANGFAGAGTFWRSRSTFTTEELNAIGVTDGRLGGNQANAAAGSRVLTIETDAVEVVSSRTGKRTFIEDRVDSRVVDDKVVETQIVPYIRPRAVLFNVNGLKPSTDVNGFFDGINVNKYIERAYIIRVEAVSGRGTTFDTTRNCGSAVSNAERLAEMPAYGQSTITVTNGSTTVTGALDAGFTSEFKTGDFIDIGGKEYKIATVTDNTHIVLDTAYTGANASDIAYKVRIPNVINTTVEVAFNHGEVIKNITAGGASAIVVGQETHKINATTTHIYLHLLNIKSGTRSAPFLAGDVLEGEYTDTPGNNSQKPRVTFVVAPTDYNSATTIRTSYTGQLHGLFRIPNNPIDRFRTGTRELMFTDAADPKTRGNTDATAIYEANGLLEIKQRTIISTRTAQLAVEQLDPEQNRIIQTTDRLTRDTGWFDPLAQTFLVQEEGGAFLSSVDLFFSSTDSNVPVRIEVREVVNGYPGQKVLPFSRVEKRPAEVYTSGDGSVKTNFKFQSPVYVQEGVEYALVILSDSAAYRVYIAETGAKDYSGATISSQPYNGVFFKSQNASTWTASQMEDLQFTLYKAQFSTGVQYRVDFVPPKLSMANLGYNPLYLKAGSNKIRVVHRNHGFKVGESVTLATRQHVTSIDAWSATDFFGSQSQIGKSHQIISAEEDAYIIQIITPTNIVASATGNIGGAYVYATENYEFTTAMVDATNTALTGTNLNFKLNTINHDDPETVVTDIVNKENYDFESAQVLRFTSNQVQTDVKVSAYMSTTNKNLSPILDTGRMSITMVNNKVDSPRWNTVNDEALDTINLANDRTILVTTGNSATDRIVIINKTGDPNNVLGDTITINDNITGLTGDQPDQKLALFNNLSELQPGNTVRFSYTGGGDYTASTLVYYVLTSHVESNNGINTRIIKFTTEDLTEVEIRPTAVGQTVDLDWLSHYNSEVATLNGSVTSTYVTKKINFSRPSEMLRIMMAAKIPNAADVEVYYKVGQSVDGELTNIGYQRAAPSAGYTKSETQFVDLSFDVEGLAPFTSVIVKIAMRSTNIAKVPRIKDFRVIACAA